MRATHTHTQTHKHTIVEVRNLCNIEVKFWYI